MKGIFGIVFLLLIGQAYAHAQRWPDRLKHYSLDDGLTANNIIALEEDAFGFIWVGTEEGLNRFDGSNFKHFLADDQVGALEANYVMELLHLGHGRMLVALANDGLQLYDPETELFTSIEHPLASNGQAYASPRSVHLESDSTVLVGYRQSSKSAGGLIRFYVRDFRSETVYPDRLNDVSYITAGIGSEIWLGDDSLYCLNCERQGDLTNFESPFRSTKNVPYYVGVLAEDDQVLISTRGDGIHVYDRATKQFISQHTYQEKGVSMIYNQSMALSPFPGAERSYWHSSRDKGIGVWDQETDVFHFIDADRSIQNFRENIMATKHMVDHRGNVWFATSAGLFMHSDDNYQIRYVDLTEAIGEENEFSAIIQVVPMGDWLFACATRSRGSLGLNASTLAFEGYAPDGGVTPSGEVFRINASDLRLSADGALRATGYNRLYEYDSLSQSWIVLLDLTEELDPISKYSALVTHEESENQRYWWFATSDNWIGRYDRLNKTLKSWWVSGSGQARKQVISPDGQLGTANRIYSIAPDGDDGAYLGTYFGVFHVNDERIVAMKDDCADCAFFERNTYGKIRRKGDQLVFGTIANGVYSYNLRDKKIRHYTRKDGLPSVRVSDFIIDNAHRIWGLTPGGLFSIDEAAAIKVRSFNEEDGLYYRDLSYREISLLPDGRAMIGLRRGVAWFYPEQLRSQPSPERTVLHEVRVNGEVVVPLSKNLVTLHYGDGLEVAFSGLGFIQPERFAYSWRIPGRTEWQTVQQPRVFFPSWRDGDFVLELRVGNHAGEWLNDIIKLEVDVIIPFIHTDAFWWLLAFLFVAMIYGIYRFRFVQLRKQASIRTEYGQRLAEIEMQALRAQMNPHFLFNSLNSIKYFIIRNQTDLAADYLTKFSRLIRLILSNSKQERVSLATELEALQLYVELEGLRFDQKFAFELTVDQNIDPDEILLPPLLIQPFAENAIWHGLMHKAEAGKLAIRLSLNGNELVCEIEDNGIGRVKAAEMRSKSATREKSMGIDITRNRLARMDSLQSSDRQIEVIDLHLPDGSASGTLVRLRIPIQY